MTGMSTPPSETKKRPNPVKTIAEVAVPFLAAINGLPDESSAMPPEVVLALTEGTSAGLIATRWERTLEESPRRIRHYINTKMSNPESTLNNCDPFRISEAPATAILFSEKRLFRSPAVDGNRPYNALYQIKDSFTRMNPEHYYKFCWLGFTLMTIDAAARNPTEVLSHGRKQTMENLVGWYHRVAQAGLQIHREVLLP